jgi:hypothetical protein
MDEYQFVEENTCRWAAKIAKALDARVKAETLMLMKAISKLGRCMQL